MFLLFLILTVYSSEIKPKLCINCKFYKNNYFTQIIGTEYGKCSRFDVEKEDTDFLVNGKKKILIENYYCSTARMSDRLCGKEGKFYEV